MRLKSELWVQAYLRRCSMNNAPTFIVRRGQKDGGAIFIKINHLNGEFDVYAPAPAGFGSGDERHWTLDDSLLSISDGDAQTFLSRQIEFDPDIWILEVEDRDGRHFLDSALIEI